jgi:hypothetical protein
MSETHPGDDLVALALDDLDPGTRAATLEHLMACRQCREEYDALAATVESTLVAAPAVGPPPGFDTRVLAALGVDPQPSAREPAPVAPPRRARDRWMWVAASAAVGLIIGVAATYTLVHDPSTPSAGPSPTPSPAPTYTIGSDLSKLDGTVVGEVSTAFVGKKQVYVVMVHTGPVGIRYKWRFRLKDGSLVPGGRVRLNSDSAVWIVPAPRATATKQELKNLELVANDGEGPLWSKARL